MNTRVFHRWRGRSVVQTFAPVLVAPRVRARAHTTTTDDDDGRRRRTTTTDEDVGSAWTMDGDDDGRARDVYRRCVRERAEGDEGRCERGARDEDDDATRNDGEGV